MNDYIAGRYELFLKDLEQVVNLDSGSEYAPGVAKVIEYFERRFSALGWRTQTHYFSEQVGPCLEVSNIDSLSEQETYDFLCVGHADTVFDEGTVAKRPFSISGDRATGPGVIDMKSGLVTVLHVAETLQHFGIADQLSLGIVFSSDEEIGSKASRAWIEKLAQKSKQVFIFEPRRATGHWVLQRKGAGGYQVLCHGKAVHAGVEPEKGINAIVELAHQIVRMNTFSNYELGTTVSVTVASGGTKLNVIPELALAEVDVRVSEASEVTRLVHLFESLPQSTHIKGATVAVRGGIGRPPMNPSEKTLQTWEQLAAIGKQLGIDMQWTGTGGASDGNLTAALGIPTIDGMGPMGGAAHSDEEYLELTSIIPTVQLMCNFCKAYVEKTLISG